MKKLFLSLIALLGFTSSGSAESPVKQIVKISVFASGDLQLNGKTSSLNEIREELNKVTGLSAEVWYYRDAAKEEPPEISFKVLDLIIAANLPVSFSTKPDFSDQVDGRTGESKPRKER